ncbi:MAG: TIGR04197 family type VII secretion effector [Lachnospiraceae bacterium]
MKGKKKMDVIQNDLFGAKSSALGMKGTGSNLESSVVSNDTDSKISAINNGQTVFTSSESAKSAYKQVLLSDADHINSLGEEFQSLDAHLSGIINKGF